MSINTNELQQLQSILGTDSLLADTAAAGTGRLSLARAAEFFGAELIKPGNPVGAALSNKAALSAQKTVEATNVPNRTVEVAAVDLPGYIAGLPKLLTENLTIYVAGTLNERLEIIGYYGSGSLSIDGQGGGKLQKGVMAIHCSVQITLSNLEVSGHLGLGTEGINNLITYSNGNKSFLMSNCTVTGSKSADSEGDVGIRVDGSSANIDNCGISGCGTAVMAAANSVVSIYNWTGDSFENNDVGPYVYYGGIILLSGSTPELLGGATSAKAGGLIVKGDGTLL